MNQPWIYMCSPSRSPLLPPSPSHPSGSSQCTSPELLSHASSLGWWCFTLDSIFVSVLFAPWLSKVHIIRVDGICLADGSWTLGDKIESILSKDFILQLEVLFSQLNYLLCESNKIYLAGLSVQCIRLGIKFSKPFTGFFPKNCTLSLIHGFCFLQFVLCLLCTLPSSCSKSSLDSRAVLQGSFLGVEGSELGSFMNKEQWLPIAKATQGLHTQLCLIGKSQPRSRRAHRGGLRPGTAGLDTCEKVLEASGCCNALHFIGWIEPIEQLWNNEIFLVRKCPCKKEKPLKLSHGHQPVLCELIQTSWVSSLLKGGANVARGDNRSASSALLWMGCCWGVSHRAMCLCECSIHSSNR